VREKEEECMEVVKDLTAELRKAEAKDRWYEIEVVIERLLAPQRYTRPFTYVKSGWGELTRVESIVDGAPEALRAPKRKVKGRKGESEIKTGNCWTFKLIDNEGETVDPSKVKDWKSVSIVVPWGQHFGIWKGCLRRSLEAQKSQKYEVVSLQLMKVYPVWLNVGNAPCESMKEGKAPEVVLESRPNGKMVEVFFDYIENRKVKFYTRIDSECPINEERFVALCKSVSNLDTVGPSKRGSIKVTSLKHVSLTEDEIKQLLIEEKTAEPVQPVIY
jgi:hypothetical protein